MEEIKKILEKRVETIDKELDYVRYLYKELEETIAQEKALQNKKLQLTTLLDYINSNDIVSEKKEIESLLATHVPPEE